MNESRGVIAEDGASHPLAIFLLFLAGGALYVWVTSGALPERIASHVGASGQANGWMSKGGYRTFMLAFTVLVPAATVWLVGWLPRIAPTMVNLPNRDYWPGPPAPVLTTGRRCVSRRAAM